MTGTALGHGQAPGTLYGIIIEIIESTLNIKYMFLFEKETGKVDEAEVRISYFLKLRLCCSRVEQPQPHPRSLQHFLQV